MKIKFLKAYNGDSILISYMMDNEPINILIDGGVSKTYLQAKNKKGKREPGELKEIIDDLKLKNQKINLLVMTHVDDDHIGGILKWFETDADANKMVEEVWFNSGRLIAEHFDRLDDLENDLILDENSVPETSIGQGVRFEDYLVMHKIWKRELITSTQEFDKLGIHFQILSPGYDKLAPLLQKWEKERPDSLTSGEKNDYEISLKNHILNDTFEEDSAVHNGSSIAFIMTYQGKRLLFLADAHPAEIEKSLAHFGYSKQNPVKAEIVKISHHGSKSNNSRSMLESIDSNVYVISTNGDKHNHPHKQFLARLIDLKSNCEIYFNYSEQIMNHKIFSPDDEKDFPYFKASALLNNEIIL